MTATSGRNLPGREVISNAMRGVVQIVALRQGFLGGMSPAWTGSGTIVHPSGLILTNCHVANPRAMGMSAPPADRLGIALTERSDQPPVLSYFAQVVAQSPEIDLAVLRIVAGVDGRQVSNLNLPYVPLGDSDDLELGDVLAILGYPGIGGDTITLTSGSVSGFSHEERLNVTRAWIKTDATISGGNSGGTAINGVGHLVGVPTQAAAGTGIQPVDARPVVDTNRDGQIDQRDTPMAIGGFINGLRPVNLASPLLQKAGLSTMRGASAALPPVQPAQPARTSPAPSPSAPAFRALVFSRDVTEDGRPIQPASLLPSGGTQLFASFEYSGLDSSMTFGEVWAWNGKTIAQKRGSWDAEASGRRTLSLMNQRGLPDGEYHLVLTLNNRVMAEGKAVIGMLAEDTDTQVSGQIVDAATNRGIANVLVLALKPGVRVQDFVRQQNKEQVVAKATTGNQGAFTFDRQLPKGQAYGLLVIARGYRDLAIDGALRITANAPEQAQLGPISLRRE
ncbi:MAG: putative serine protease HtrA [Chloroflexi bacterium ADurb.Bin180]|nr:MAG: putative serine protease HtrA [Chloroflexi bacterium ADurb.Bin180]